MIRRVTKLGTSIPTDAPVCICDCGWRVVDATGERHCTATLNNIELANGPLPAVWLPLRADHSYITGDPHT